MRGETVDRRSEEWSRLVHKRPHAGHKYDRFSRSIEITKYNSKKIEKKTFVDMLSVLAKLYKQRSILII